MNVHYDWFQMTLLLWCYCHYSRIKLQHAQRTGRYEERLLGGLVTQAKPRSHINSLWPRPYHSQLSTIEHFKVCGVIQAFEKVYAPAFAGIVHAYLLVLP